MQYFYFLRNAIVNSVGFGIGQVGAFEADFDPTQILANEIAREATEGEVEAYLDDQAQLALPHGRVGSLPPGGTEGQQLVKRSNHNFDTEWVPAAIVRRTTKFDLTLATKQALAPEIPAGKDLIVFSAVFGNSDLDMSDGSYNEIAAGGIQFGFNSGCDDYTAIDSSALLQLTTRKKNVVAAMTNGSANNCGVAGEVFGAKLSPGITPLEKGFSISGNLILKTIKEFDLTRAVMTVAGMADGRDNGDYPRAQYANSKCYFEFSNGSNIQWVLNDGGRWEITSGEQSAVVAYGTSETDYPSDTTFLWVDEMNLDPPPTVTRGTDLVTTHGPLKHRDAWNGRRAYLNDDGTQVFEFNGDNWRFTETGAGFFYDSLDATGDDPWESNYLHDGPFDIEGPSTSPFLGEWTSFGTHDGRASFINEDGDCVARWDVGDNVWRFTRGLGQGYQRDYYEAEPGEDTPTPVGSDFLDLSLTGGSVPEPVEGVAPTIDITILYYLEGI